MLKRILFILIFIPFLVSGQAPGCPNVDLGSDSTISCDSASCVTLEAQYLDVGQTTSYTVTQTPYAPPYPFTGGTPIFIGIDDVWSNTISLPFNFCFFGNTYNQVVIGTNGVISFDLSNSGGFCAWSFNNSIPTATGVPYQNSINGAYHDMDPSIGGNINYAVLGTYPCRTFVVNYNNVPHFLCNTISTTQQIVIYETTNVIEIYIDDKPTCNSWNSGNALIGIQNANGTLGYTPPNRNTGSWSASQEAWRFTPSGPSICSVNWYESGISTPIGNSDTITVCPLNTTNYIAEVTYNRCDGIQVVETDTIEVDLGCCPPQLNKTINPPSCVGGNDGDIQVAFSNTNILAINWIGPNGFTSNSVNLSNLVAGEYVATVTYSNNCPPLLDTISLTDPSIMSTSYIANDITCFGYNDGSIDITIVGGTPPYNASWTGPNSFISNNPDINQLEPGIYSVLVSDDNNCTSFYNIQIEEPMPININASITDLSCISVNDGVVDVLVSGGVPSYTFSWNNGGNSPFLINLSVGDYILTVIDGNNCLLTDTFTVNAATFETSSIFVEPKCYSGSDGAIDLEVVGGNYPFTYQWSSGQTTEDIVNVPSGLYQVSITDVTNCTIDTLLYINQPTELNAITFPTPVSCYSGNNGAVNLQIIGGLPPYNTDWFGVDTIQMEAGLYSYEVTDENGCVFSSSVTITEPDSLEVSFNKIDVQCYGESNGSIDMIVQLATGTPGYTYNWTGPDFFTSTAEDINNLIAGTYSVIIQDANNCSHQYIVTINQPNQLNQYIDIQTSNYNGYNIACRGENSGWISVDVSGGYIPFSYLWDNGDTSNSISNLYTGLYSVEITDALGCKSNYSLTLSEPQDVMSGFLNVTTDYNGFSVSCFNANDGAIQANVFGGVSPYSYNWINGMFGDSVSDLYSGYHEVHVFDDNNCLWIDSISLSEPDSLILELIIAPDTCDRLVGYAEAVVNGGVAPYSYYWSSLDSISFVNDLQSGDYSLTLNDANNCQIYNLFEIQNLESPDADFMRYPEYQRFNEQYENPFVFLDQSNSYWQKISYWNWDFIDSNGDTIRHPLTDSTISHAFNKTDTFIVLLTIVTQYNCIDTISKKVIVNDFDIFIPNAFTPLTQDNINDRFSPYGFGIKKIKLQVYNRWGGLVHDRFLDKIAGFNLDNTIDFGWDGTHLKTNEICPIGNYTYYIEVESIFGEFFKYQGVISLIR